MKIIDNRTEYKKIREIEFTAGFFLAGRLYIRTAKRDDDHNILAMDASSGQIIPFADSTLVAAANIELVITDGN